MGGDGLLAAVDLGEVIARFADRLHAAGVPVTPATAARCVDAIELAAPATTGELYWLCRVTMVPDRRDLATFDACFGSVFRGLVDVADVLRNPDVPITQRLPAEAGQPKRGDGRPSPSADAPRRDPVMSEQGDGRGDDDAMTSEAVLAAVSEIERLRQRPFEACTPDELERLGELMARLTVAAPTRSSRRARRSPSGRDLDLRATLRAAQRTGGDPLHHIRRRRRRRPRRVVLIADVSGSMESYGRAYLYLLHGAVRAVRAEAFVFATRLHRLSRQLSTSSPAAALASAMAAVPDWSGGTRLGATLRHFNDGWGRRGLARGAVVVIVSDGWDSGDPAVVGVELERLSRLAHRIVWVNPRRQSDRYQPLAGGMAAALPFVDDFVSGHSLAALDEVIAAIGRG